MMAVVNENKVQKLDKVQLEAQLEDAYERLHVAYEVACETSNYDGYNKIAGEIGELNKLLEQAKKDVS